MFNFLGVFDQLIVVKHAATGELFWSHISGVPSCAYENVSDILRNTLCKVFERLVEKILVYTLLFGFFLCFKHWFNLSYFELVLSRNVPIMIDESIYDRWPNEGLASTHSNYYHQKLSFYYNLTHLMPMISFYTHWKHPKTSGLLCFKGTRKRPKALQGLKKKMFFGILSFTEFCVLFFEDKKKSFCYC